MIKSTILLLLISLLPTFVFGSQLAEIDSLYSVIKQSDNKKENVTTYIKIARLYQRIDVDSAMDNAKKAYKISKSNNFRNELAESSATIADIYVLKNDLSKAKENYEIALQIFSETEDTYLYTEILMIIGNIYLAKDEYVDALITYNKALKISKENNYKNIIPNLHNNLGVLYLSIEDYDDANTYFEQAHKLFMQNGDSYSATLALINISFINSMLGNNEGAIKGYLGVIDFFTEKENWLDIADAYNRISIIYYSEDNYDKSLDYLQKSLNTLNRLNLNFEGPSAVIKADIYANAANVYYELDKLEKSQGYAQQAIRLSLDNSFKKNVYENARVLATIYDKYNQADSSLFYHKLFVQYYDDFQKELDIKRITKIKMQNEFNDIIKVKEKAEIIYKANQERKELINIIIIGLVLSLGIIGILLYLNQKKKTAKSILQFKNSVLEKQQLENDIEYKNKELATNMMYLIEKNEFIKSVAEKLVDIKDDVKKSNQDFIYQTIKELNQNSSSKIWDEFEIRFKEVHSDFYEKLHIKHPDLTPNEIKICAFLKLNMSTKDICAITHQSEKSVNMARYRLRKKLNIDQDENLIQYLVQL
ncbi:MAG: hypothetical protein DRI84_05345 [Bacteroidetes bacterium]|nr:MAG: hypothetical protein DRI84_05345 [Bacteroidota bacterium]